MSFAEIAREINAGFGTAYSSKRGDQPQQAHEAHRAQAPPKPLKLRPQTRAEMPPKSREDRAMGLAPAAPASTPASPARRPEPVVLRCVGVSPRLVSLTELKASDCRYPYGGDKENEPMREPITEGQRKAVLRLNTCERELGADGSAIVHDVLVQGMTMEQVGQRRGLKSQRWNDYFARRFKECLDRLISGLATEKKPRPRGFP
jgi:GcrA cell cycle regulator